jgi:hypothetical protein
LRAIFRARGGKGYLKAEYGRKYASLVQSGNMLGDLAQRAAGRRESRNRPSVGASIQRHYASTPQPREAIVLKAIVILIVLIVSTSIHAQAPKSAWEGVYQPPKSAWEGGGYQPPKSQWRRPNTYQPPTSAWNGGYQPPTSAWRSPNAYQPPKSAWTDR